MPKMSDTFSSKKTLTLSSEEAQTLSTYLEIAVLEETGEKMAEDEGEAEDLRGRGAEIDEIIKSIVARLR